MSYGTFEERFDWWRSDAGFKAPEVLDPWYAMRVMNELAEVFPEAQPRQLAEGEYKRVFELLGDGDYEGMKSFLQGDSNGSEE